MTHWVYLWLMLSCFSLMLTTSKWFSRANLSACEFTSDTRSCNREPQISQPPSSAPSDLMSGDVGLHQLVFLEQSLDSSEIPASVG